MFQQVVGVLAIVLSLAGIIPYIISILRRRTIPHLFTWIIWTTMTGVAFLAQVSDQAGPGAWVTGVTALLCIVVLGLCVRYGETDIRPLDWVSLALASSAGVLWAITSSPVTAVILISFIDAVGFVPTLRKSWHKPRSEPLLNYHLSAIKHGLSILALTHFSIVTMLYPAVVGFMNLLMIICIRSRRFARDAIVATSDPSMEMSI
jgi:hypothetical protein